MGFIFFRVMIKDGNPIPIKEQTVFDRGTLHKNAGFGGISEIEGIGGIKVEELLKSIPQGHDIRTTHQKPSWRNNVKARI